MVSLLFLGGPSRSGTTALADYLNLHEEILLCRERYKYVADEVTPAAFALKRILDYEPRQGKGEGAETNIPKEYHVDLLAGKDPSKLKWIGDKFPNYVKRLETLWQNNPNARFILTYRPVEEVAESYEERSRDLNDPWLGGRNGFEIGVMQWNEAMRRTRKFVESVVNPPVLIVGYHDFFRRNEEFILLISRFLNLEFDDSVREAWRSKSRDFEEARREKKALTEQQVAFLAEHKDHEVERWLLERIERQWTEPGLYASRKSRDPVIALGNPRGMAAALIELQLRTDQEERRISRLRQRIGELENEMAERRRESDIARERNRKLRSRAGRLRRRLREIRSSRSWRLLMGLGKARSTLLGGIRRIM